MTDTPAPPAGFYDDGSGRQRYWDGAAWTDQYQDVPPADVPAAAPVKKKRRALPIVLASVGAFIVILVIIGALSNHPSTTNAADTAPTHHAATHSSAPAPKAGESLDNPAPVGSGIVVTSSSGNYEITFAAPTFDATTQVHAQNQFNDAPQAGMQYLMDKVSIKNTGTTAIDFNPLIQLNGLTFVTSDGQAYQQKMLLVLPSSLSDVQSIAPGTVASGNVVWEVPSGTTSGTWALSGGGASEFVSA